MYKNLHPHNFVKNKGYSYMHKNQGTVSETHAISSLLLLLLPSVESSRVTTYKELKWHWVKKQKNKHVSSLATDYIFHLLGFFFLSSILSVVESADTSFPVQAHFSTNQPTDSHPQDYWRILKGFIPRVCTYQDNNTGSKRLYVTLCSSVCAICVPQWEARFPTQTRFIHTSTFWHLHGGHLFNSNWKRNNGYI